MRAFKNKEKAFNGGIDNAKREALYCPGINFTGLYLYGFHLLFVGKIRTGNAGWTPEAAAKYIVTGVERDKPHVIEPRQLRIIFALSKFFPGLVK